MCNPARAASQLAPTTTTATNPRPRTGRTSGAKAARAGRRGQGAGRGRPAARPTSTEVRHTNVPFSHPSEVYPQKDGRKVRSRWEGTFTFRPAPRGRLDMPDVEPHRVLHGRLPEGSASGSRRPADSSGRCRRLPPPAAPTVPSGSRSVRFRLEIGPGELGAPAAGYQFGPGTLKDPTLKDSKDPQEADLEPPFPPDARPRPLTYDHASQRTTARTGHLTPPWNQPFGPVAARRPKGCCNRVQAGRTGPGPRCRVVSPGPRACGIEGLPGFPAVRESAPSFAGANCRGSLRPRRLSAGPVAGSRPSWPAPSGGSHYVTLQT